MELKNSKTWANLQAAFAGESMARMKYDFYAKKAKNDGFVGIGDVFEETAKNEKAHAKIWYKLINGIGSTQQNLDNAADGEHEEWTNMYKGFAQTAKEEGFDEISALFEKVGEIEKFHYERFAALSKELEQGMVFQKDNVVIWQCSVCGHLHTGKCAPSVCPVCFHPQSHFKEYKEN